MSFATAVVTVIYAYMPLRASYVVAAKLDPTLALGLPPGRPFWDWGDPRSVTNIISVVSGAQISATHAFGSFLSVAALMTSFFVRGTRVGDSSRWPILLISVAFSIVGLVRDWRFGIFLLAPTLVISPFIASFSAESDPLRYYIVPFWGLCIVAALGFDLMLSWIQRHVRWANALAVGAVVLLAGHNVFTQRSLFVQRSDRLGFNYIDNVLAATSDGSIIVAPWTYATPIAYAAYVQHRLASRVLVAGDAIGLQAYFPKWFENHRIFVVSEDRPDVPVCCSEVRLQFLYHARLAARCETLRINSGEALASIGRIVLQESWPFFAGVYLEREAPMYPSKEAFRFSEELARFEEARAGDMLQLRGCDTQGRSRDFNQLEINRKAKRLWRATHHLS